MYVTTGDATPSATGGATGGTVDRMPVIVPTLLYKHCDLSRSDEHSLLGFHMPRETWSHICMKMAQPYQLESEQHGFCVQSMDEMAQTLEFARIYMVHVPLVSVGGVASEFVTMYYGKCAMISTTMRDSLTTVFVDALHMAIGKSLGDSIMMRPDLKFDVTNDISEYSMALETLCSLTRASETSKEAGKHAWVCKPLVCMAIDSLAFRHFLQVHAMMGRLFIASTVCGPDRLVADNPLIIIKTAIAILQHELCQAWADDDVNTVAQLHSFLKEFRRRVRVDDYGAVHAVYLAIREVFGGVVSSLHYDFFTSVCVYCIEVTLKAANPRVPS